MNITLIKFIKWINVNKTGLAGFLTIVFLSLSVNYFDGQAQARNQTLYETKGCVACHGSAGVGASAPKLAGTPRGLSWFRNYIRNPAGSMPPMSRDVVSDEEIAQIWESLRTK